MGVDYQQVFLNSSSPMVVMDATSHRFVDANPAAAAIYGFAGVQETLGKTPVDVSAPVQYDGTPSQEQASRYIARALAEGSVVFDWRHQRPSGTIWDAEVHLRRFESDGCSLLQFTLIDITERRRVAGELAQSRANLSALIESTSDLIWSVDHNFGLLTYNSAFAEHFRRNYGTCTSIGAPPEKLAPPERAVMWPPLYRRASEEGPFKSECILSDGRTLELSFHPIVQSGESVGISVFGKDITERKRAEVVLRANAARLSTLLNTLPDLVWFKDPEGVYLNCNRRFESFFGAKERDIVGKTDYDFVDRELADFFRAHDGKAMAAGQPTMNEEEVTFAVDGHREYLETIKTPVHGAGGELLGVLGIGRDITARKRAERELRDAQQGAERYLSAAEVVLVGLGLDARVTLLNRKGYAVLGYAAGELSGKDWFSVCLPPEECDAARASYRRMVLEEIELVAYHESHIIRGDGEERLIAWHNKLVRDDAGRVSGSLSSGEDITERRRIEVAEAAERDFNELLIHSTPAFYVAIDNLGRVRSMNATMLRRLGYALDEVAGVDYLTTFVPAEDRPALGEVFARIIQSRERTVNENRILTKDGEVLLCEWHGTPIFREDRFDFFMGMGLDITVRKQAELALSDSEKQFRSLFENMLNGVMVLDVLLDDEGHSIDHRLIQANAVFDEMTGLKRGEQVGRTSAELSFQWPTDVAERYYAVAFGAEPLVMERYNESLKRYYDIRVFSPRRGQFAMVFHEITQRKQAEARLRQEAERTAILLELHAHAPLLTDKELFDFALEQAVRLTDSKIGFLHRINADQQSIALTTWSQSALEGCTAAYETHYPMSAAGNWVDCVRQQRPTIYNDYVSSPNRKGLPAGHAPVQRFVSIPVMEGSEVRLVLGVGNKGTDYTQYDASLLQLVANELHKLLQQRHAEAELRIASENAERYLSVAEVILVAFDDKSQITLLNRKGYCVLGYEEGELTGKNWFRTCLPAEEYETVFAVYQQILSGELAPVEYFENHVLRKDGERRLIAWHNTALRDGAGRITGSLSSGEDITERKHAEEQQRQVEARLNQAQKMEAIGTLAGGIAHDFNNILGGILGNTELALMELPEGSPARELLGYVEQSADRAVELVRQILAFSRQTMQERKPIPLFPIVKEVLKLLRASLPVTIQIAERCYSSTCVLADAGQFHQIVMNLCTNAGLAMRERGGVLTVGLRDIESDAALLAKHPELSPGRYVRLTMTDTGCGIPTENLSRIFEPFFTTRPAGEGTGLGLSVVHGIVKSWGGAIGVSSEVGSGTTFEIFLPAAEAIANEAAEGAKASRGRERVLFIDDEAALTRVAQQGLQRFGYVVAAFNDPLRALEAFRANPGDFDIVITDMTMPELTGDVVAAEVRRLRPDIPIVLASGFWDRIAVDRARAAGVDEFVDKPLRLDTLAQLIRKRFEPC